MCVVNGFFRIFPPQTTSDVEGERKLKVEFSIFEQS